MNAATSREAEVLRHMHRHGRRAWHVGAAALLFFWRRTRHLAPEDRIYAVYGNYARHRADRTMHIGYARALWSSDTCQCCEGHRPRPRRFGWTPPCSTPS